MPAHPDEFLLAEACLNPVRRDLIFDLGLFEGQDSRFYLDKGFTVVAVEANPEYAAFARQKFTPEIATRRFHLVERALWGDAGRSIPFHVWGAQSSVMKQFADIGGPSVPVDVITTTVAELLAQHGVPYYLKCDLEGADKLVVAQLQLEKELPAFVSVEASSGEAIEQLARCGYDRFQIINQGYHAGTRIPFPPREGIYAKTAMNDTMTGLFGRELDPRHWMPKQEALAAMKRREFILSPGCNALLRYAWRRIGKITGRRYLIAQGWTDVHACRHSTLEADPAA